MGPKSGPASDWRPGAVPSSWGLPWASFMPKMCHLCSPIIFWVLLEKKLILTLFSALKAPGGGRLKNSNREFRNFFFRDSDPSVGSTLDLYPWCKLRLEPIKGFYLSDPIPYNKGHKPFTGVHHHPNPTAIIKGQHISMTSSLTNMIELI